MTAKKQQASSKVKVQLAPEPEPEAADDEPAGEIIARPDGYYWLTLDGRQEFGPFETREQAAADMASAEDEAPEPGETLQEAESEIGIADWIDPDIGEPAQGFSTPRLDGD
jgi:hypothetical protein